MQRLAAAGVLLILASTVADAANPTLQSILPQGGQRGTTLEAAIRGTRMDGTEEILFYEPGIEVEELEVEKNNSVKLKLKIADDARLGTHAMRVRTATGVSQNMLLFSVGVLPEVSEVEPNTTFDTPQKIDFDVTVNGVADREDVDFYIIEAKKGQRISAEVEGVRLGRPASSSTFFDPYLSIMNMDRFELASSDDDALAWNDAIVSILAPEDGTYVIQVRDSSYVGGATCNYRLHVGDFPRPKAVLPAGGRFGQELEVTLLGDVSGPMKKKIKLPKETDFYSFIFAPDFSNFAVFADDKLGVAPTPNLLRLTNLDNVIEQEPNNEVAKGTEFTAPMALNGVVNEPGDVDHFRFTMKKNQQFDVTVHARSIRSPLDPVLTIYDERGRRVTSNDDNRSPDSYARFKAPADGVYSISVTDMLGDGGESFAYRIEVTEIKPSLVLGLPEPARYTDAVLTVPQGNRGAVLISAARDGFRADVNLEIKNLPKGVTYETVPMAASANQVAVLFTAAADAPKDGGLLQVIGTVPDQPEIVGHLRQDSMLIRGQNARPVWNHITDRLAMAVTEQVPFELEIVEPKVPLVRGGSMKLKVRAKRAEGFDGDITLYLIQNPPGVSSSRSVKITKGKTEAEIPLTANATAALETAKICVVGSATVGNGPVEAATPLANLTVAQPYFNLTFKAAAVEQGQPAQLLAEVENTTPFEGAAKVELVGLPGNTTAEPIEITKDSTEAVFTIQTAAESPAGRHKSLMCRLIVTQHGEEITHMIGPTELRIDKPLPAPTAAPKPKPKPAAGQVAAQPKAKPLSRLEQLRQQREAAAAANNQEK